jgi:hypothetical protein
MHRGTLREYVHTGGYIPLLDFYRMVGIICVPVMLSELTGSTCVAAGGRSGCCLSALAEGYSWRYQRRMFPASVIQIVLLK